MTVWDSPTNDVFILGAGFSRALSPHLPLTDELGNACLEKDAVGQDSRVPAGGFKDGAFESWLSGLAEPQPYLSEQQNLENQALFLRFSDAIAVVLGERVDLALREAAPGWLPRFLAAAHCRRSRLITFNYDTLVECAVGARQLFLPGYVEPVAWTEILGNVPGWAAGDFRLAATQVDTMRLLKLHGSLNWYWAPGDASGVSMARRWIPGWYGASFPYREEDRRRELPGRVPFVVPPSAIKSSYYRNPIVREVWTQAAEALQKASKVYIFGYSLPATDTTFSGMLSQTLRHTSAPVQLADTKPGQILDRLAALGLDRSRLSTADDSHDDPIAAAAETFCRQTSALAVSFIRSRSGESLADPMVVAWTADAYAAVTDCSTEGQDVVLTVEEAAAIGRVTRVRPGTVLPKLEDALARSRESSSWLLRDNSGGLQEVIDWTHYTVDVGYGRGHWNVLTPSGGAPESLRPRER